MSLGSPAAMRVTRFPGGDSRPDLPPHAPRLSRLERYDVLLPENTRALCEGIEFREGAGFRPGSAKAVLILRVLAVIEPHLVTKVLAGSYRCPQGNLGMLACFWNVAKMADGSLRPPNHGKFLVDLAAAAGRRLAPSEVPDMGSFLNRLTVWRTTIVRSDSRHSPLPESARYSRAAECLGSVDR